MTMGLATFDEAGFELYDEGTNMGAIGAVDAAPLLYVPNLADVGHGASYNPGSIAGDAHALNFLGFIPDPILTQIPDTSGDVGTDQAQGRGAFNPQFQVAVRDFQTETGITVDGFIGPQTRQRLALAVAAHNAQTPIAPPFTPPIVPPIPGVPPGLPPVTPPGVVPPGVQPQPPAQAEGLSAAAKVGIGAAVVSVVGLVLWWALD